VRRLLIAVLALALIAGGGVSAPPSAHAATGATISGVVTHPTAGWTGTLSARLDTIHPYSTTRSAPVASDGTFTFTNVPAATYQLVWVYNGTGNFLSQGYLAAPGVGRGPTFVVADGEVLVANGAIEVGGIIRGTISTSNGAALVSPQVGASFFNGTGITSIPGVVDPVTGAYEIGALPPQSYAVHFVDGDSGPWYDEYWNDKRSYSEGTRVQLALGATVTANATLDAYASVVGQVLRPASGGGLVPLQYAYVEAWGADTTLLVHETRLGASQTDANGQFELERLPGASVRIRVTPRPETGLAIEWWQDSATRPASSVLTVPAGQEAGPVTIELGTGATLTGTVKTADGTGVGGTQIVARAAVTGQNTFDEVARTTALPDGSFTLRQLPPGTYVLDTIPPSGSPLSGGFWGGRSLTQATRVTVAEGATQGGYDIVLTSSTTTPLEMSRIQGDDRFDVGVNVTRALYPVGSVPAQGIPVLYVANGYNFPDALAAGPAASLQGGAVLLVEPTAIPTAVAEEIARLRPQRIVVAGGPASVSPTVVQRLQAMVSSPAMVSRAGGVDRYEASRNVIRDAFLPAGTETAIITTGANFPDALSAGPAAAMRGSPVILVDGSMSTLDTETRRLLLDLGVTHVYIAGGTGSVHPGIETALGSLLGGANNVVRLAGVDRYEVGVLLSQWFFSTSGQAFVATGQKFPDALTGGPLAAASGSPLFLSQPECLPRHVAAEIAEIDARALVLLGGPGSLFPAVERRELC